MGAADARSRRRFPSLIQGFTGGDPATQSPSRVARALWAIRWKLGEIFGWDDEGSGIGERVRSLRERLPEDLRESAPGPEFETLPFSSLYLTENEWAAEIANSTVHGVMHIGWVPDDDGPGYHGEMAVYVKPNGPMGNVYMAAIRPFRHLIVYPPMLRQIEIAWRDRAPNAPLVLTDA